MITVSWNTNAMMLRAEYRADLKLALSIESGTSEITSKKQIRKTSSTRLDRDSSPLNSNAEVFGAANHNNAVASADENKRKTSVEPTILRRCSGSSVS